MTSDILIEPFRAWLFSRKYKESTINGYVRPLKVAAERGAKFSEINALDPSEFYCYITGRGSPSRHTARSMYQSIFSYREFLERTGGVV